MNQPRRRKDRKIEIVMDPQHHTKTHTFTLIAGTLGSFLLVGLIFVTGAGEPSTPVEPVASGIEPLGNEYAQVGLEARAAYVYDVRNGRVLYERNAELQLPLASLTKLMTATVASELSTQTRHTITPSDLLPEGDSGLVPGESLTLGQLLHLSLAASSNDATAAVAAAIRTAKPGVALVDRMNERARELGLTQTYFLNETGLDRGVTVSGGYGSARDVAVLFQHALENLAPLLETTRESDVLVETESATHELRNTNELVSSIPGLIAGKTGFTDLAGGNLVMGIDVGLQRPIVIVILGSTAKGRFTDMQRLVTATYAAITREETP